MLNVKTDYSLFFTLEKLKLTKSAQRLKTGLLSLRPTVHPPFLEAVEYLSQNLLYGDNSAQFKSPVPTEGQ